MSYGTCNACGSDDCEGYDACTIRSLRAEVERLRDLFAAEQKATHAALTRDADQIERLKAERDAARAEVERLREALRELNAATSDSSCYCRTRTICPPCDRVILAREKARAALAGAPSETRLTHASVGCACGGSASWPHGPHDERREQDRALAERVRERIAERLTQGYERDAAAIVRALDLDALLEEP